MKFKSLLATASVVALLPMTASALVLNNHESSGAAHTTVIIPSTEATLTAGAFAGEVAFNVVSSTSLPASDTINVVVTLPPGTALSRGMVAADIDQGVTATQTTTASIVSAGPGSTTATFTVALGAGVDSDFEITVPTAVTDCAALDDTGFSVAVTLVSTGAGVDGGTAVAAAVPASYIRGALAAPVGFFDACESSLNGAAFVAATDGPTLTLASDFKAIGAGDDVLGSINPGVNTDAFSDFTTQLAAGDVTNVAFTVTAVDGSIIEDLTLDGEVVAAAAATPNVFEFDFAPTATFDDAADPAVAATADDLTIDLEAAAAADPSYSAQAALTVGDIVYTILGEEITVSPGGTLSGIDREVSGGGTFEWTSEENANSVFRITGLTAATVMNVTSTNSNTGMNMTWSGTVTPTNGEVVLSSLSGLGVGATGYGRADLTFEFETSDPVDVDRLIVQAGDIFELQSVTD